MKSMRNYSGAAVLMAALTIILLQIAAPAPVEAQVMVDRTTTILSDTTAATTAWDTTYAPIGLYTLIVHNDGAAGEQLLVALAGAEGATAQIRIDYDDPPLVLENIKAATINRKAITGTVRNRLIFVKR